MVKIAIIGGTGRFGRLFARLFMEEGHQVTITGRTVSRGKRVAKEIGVEYSQDNRAAAREADVVIISVYIENTTEAIEEVAPHVRPGCLLMDLTSVKVEPVDAMVEHAQEGVDIIGTHPMFGPRVSSMEGLVFIVTPVRGEKWKTWLLEFLEEKKAKVYETTPEEHDMIMSVVQGLTHFTYIAVASTLKELDIDVKLSRQFASPIYGLMLDLIARIVGQSPQLYASIQTHNPLSVNVHEAFIKEAERLKRAVAEKDLDTFKKIMIDAARHMGDLDSAMGRSDKAILALTEELKKLRESVGKEVALRHIYSNVVHVGAVERVDHESVTLQMRGKEMVLKLSNVELLDDEFLRRWRIENLPPKSKSQDFSALFPKDADGDVIARVLSNSIEGIVEARVIDIYEGEQVPKGQKSITFRVDAVEVSAFAEVPALILGIGGRIR
jgi:prephenate dehydrogenase